MYKLVKDYQASTMFFKVDGIPVGAINIDSLWAQCLNNFVVDKTKFPNLPKLISDMHAQNIKVILVSSIPFSGQLRSLIRNVLSTSKVWPKSTSSIKARLPNGGTATVLSSISSTLRPKSGSKA